MKLFDTVRSRALLGMSFLAFAAMAPLAEAQSLFAEPAAFSGAVRAGGKAPGQPVHAGDTVVFSGRQFAPGQAVTLLRGTTPLNEAPILADAEGNFSFDYALPADAALGLQPVVVVTSGPDSAGVVEVKVSPEIPLSGEARFDIQVAPLVRGLYQVAYGATGKALYVTAAVGRPPVKESALLKVDPETLEILAQAAPAAAPARADGREGGVFAVYGLGTDDAAGTVWVTNTRQNTVAVYRQDDLSLVKQFPENSVAHPRDVVIDGTHGRAYVSAGEGGVIAVFDTATLEQIGEIAVTSARRGGAFTVMSLDLDAEAGKLYTVSMTTPEAAEIDLASQAVRIIPVPGAVRGSGIAHDTAGGRLFVASQDSDDLIVVDTASGKVLQDVAVGAGALNVAFDPESGLAYVASRGAGTLTAVDGNGAIVANLDGGSYPNHLMVHEGQVFAVNKSLGENDPEGDRLRRIVPKP